VGRPFDATWGVVSLARLRRDQSRPCVRSIKLLIGEICSVWSGMRLMPALLERGSPTMQRQTLLRAAAAVGFATAGALAGAEDRALSGPPMIPDWQLLTQPPPSCTPAAGSRGREWWDRKYIRIRMCCSR
jgi:hypothetical protein